MYEKRRNVRKTVYEKYVSYHFGFSHNLKNIEIEYEKRYWWFKEHVWRFIKNLDKNSKVLVIGCGLGHELYALQKLGFKDVLGVDISPECINFCQEYGFNVIKMDIFEFLSNDAKTFDLIVAFDIIEHFTREESLSLAKLVYKSLSSGGIFIINVPNANNPLALRDRYIDLTHETIYTPESMRQLLLSAGFKKIRIVGVKSFSTIDESMQMKIFKKIIALPIYRLSLFILKMLYYMSGMFDIEILNERILAIGEK